jgi:regulator of sigma D
LRKPILTENCRRHRRPDIFYRVESAFYLQLYSRISRYNDQRQVKQGDQEHTIQLINVQVLKTFCQELGIDFLQTFEILDTIAEQWSEHNGR